MAELGGRGKTLSKVEFFPLDILEVPRLCFRDFTREGLVFERWKNCRYRPDDPLLDALPVKNEKGLLNLYGTSDSLFERTLSCALRAVALASDLRGIGLLKFPKPAKAALMPESNASSAEVVFPC